MENDISLNSDHDYDEPDSTFSDDPNYDQLKIDEYFKHLDEAIKSPSEEIDIIDEIVEIDDRPIYDLEPTETEIDDSPFGSPCINLTDFVEFEQIIREYEDSCVLEEDQIYHLREPLKCEMYFRKPTKSLPCNFEDLPFRMKKVTKIIEKMDQAAIPNFFDETDESEIKVNENWLNELSDEQIAEFQRLAENKYEVIDHSNWPISELEKRVIETLKRFNDDTPEIN